MMKKYQMYFYCLLLIFLLSSIIGFLYVRLLKHIDILLTIRLVFIYAFLILVSVWLLIIEIYRIFSRVEFLVSLKFNNLENLLLDLRDGTKAYLKERRKFSRLKGDIVARASGRDELIKVLDIGYGGARLRTSGDFNLGEVLELNIFLPIFAQPISVKVKVVWASVVKTGDQREGCEVGIEYLDINRLDRERLAETIKLLGRSRHR